MATTKQIGFVHGLIRKADMTADKEELVKQHTDGRTTHISEMTNAEIQSIVKTLGGNDERRARLEGKILSMAHEMGWELADGAIDMERVDGWLVKHTKHHKRLNDLTTTELPGVVSVFEKMYQQFLKTL